MCVLFVCVFLLAVDGSTVMLTVPCKSIYTPLNFVFVLFFHVFMLQPPISVYFVGLESDRAIILVIDIRMINRLIG